MRGRLCAVKYPPLSARSPAAAASAVLKAAASESPSAALCRVQEQHIHTQVTAVCNVVDVVARAQRAEGAAQVAQRASGQAGKRSSVRVSPAASVLVPPYTSLTAQPSPSQHTRDHTRGRGPHCRSCTGKCRRCWTDERQRRGRRLRQMEFACGSCSTTTTTRGYVSETPDKMPLTLTAFGDRRHHRGQTPELVVQVTRTREVGVPAGSDDGRACRVTARGICQ